MIIRQLELICYFIPQSFSKVALREEMWGGVIDAVAKRTVLITGLITLG